MEMSQRIHFWYQILLKMLIFLRKWQKKNHFLGQKFLWQANKNYFELKMPKFLENHVHREIVPPRETVAIAIVGRGGWGSLPYTVANENQMKA